MAVAAAVRDVDRPALRLEGRERLEAGGRLDARQREARQHAHDDGQHDVDRERAAEDQPHLPHAGASPASEARGAVAGAGSRPYAMRHTFHANTTWLRNIMSPPTPRQMKNGWRSITDWMNGLPAIQSRPWIVPPTDS